MERHELEQLLDFATRDWRADWRGNFGGETTQVERGADFVTLYLYVHRVRDCEPGVYRWDQANRKLEQLHRGNVQRVAAFLSLEQVPCRKFMLHNFHDRGFRRGGASVRQPRLPLRIF